MYLFLMSLWRALQLTSVIGSPSLFALVVFPLPTQTMKVNLYREVCVTVGLSSEVCLLPNANKICDFWLFLG